MSQKTLLLFVIDGLALCGVVAFSVLYALQPHKQWYLIGQIVSAMIILAVAIILQQRQQVS